MSPGRFQEGLKISGIILNISIKFLKKRLTKNYVRCQKYRSARSMLRC